MGWCYLFGMVFFSCFLGLVIDHLVEPSNTVGIYATATLVIAQCFILKGITLAASRTAFVMEDYLGDEVPLPLMKDPNTGEWVVKAELEHDETSFPCCITFLSCFSTIFGGIPRGGEAREQGGYRRLAHANVNRDEDQPTVLGASSSTLYDMDERDGAVQSTAQTYGTVENNSSEEDKATRSSGTGGNQNRYEV